MPPHAVAFRNFEAELTHVSQLSSAITHADPRCQWGCIFLNRTLANLVRGESNPLGDALEAASPAPDELRMALTAVQEAVQGERDRETFESQLSTTGYVVDSLQAGLYYGLTAESVESAVIQAVNQGDDTDTVGAIAGTVAGARFGVTDIPRRWRTEINEADELERLAEQLLSIRQHISAVEYGTMGDGTLVLKHRCIQGPAYISTQDFQEATIGHRPHPAPHRTIDTAYHELTPWTAAILDWERRAYAVYSDRCSTYASPQINNRESSGYSRPQLVPVPQYPFVEAFDELPERDQNRIIRDGRAAADAFVEAYVAFTEIRHPITEAETTSVGIERMDPIAGATRVLVQTFGDACEVLFGTDKMGGYDSPADIEAAFDTAAAAEVLTTRPRTVRELTDILTQLVSSTAAILDYITQLRLPETGEPTAETSPRDQLGTLRDSAHTMVGELFVLYETLRRIAVRHPEIEYRQWQTNKPL